MNEYVDQIRSSVHGPSGRRSGTQSCAARVGCGPQHSRISPHRQSAWVRRLGGAGLEMMSRCDGGFESTFIDAIGAGRIVTTVNQVNATRNGRSISYNTVWTFRFD